jgi:hypothetical protein
VGRFIPSQCVTDIPRRGWRGSRRLLASECIVSRSKSTAHSKQQQQQQQQQQPRPNSFNSRVTSSSTSDPTEHHTSLFFSFSGYTFLTHSFTYPHSLPRRSFFYLVACACNDPNHHYWPVTSYQPPSNPFGRNEDRPSPVYRVTPLSTITY